MDQKTGLTEDDLLRYLEYEKEVFGAFSLPEQELELADDQVVSEDKEAAKERNEKEIEAEGKAEADRDSLKSLAERLEACTTLDELRVLCASADELKTDLENTNLVFGVGNPQADLMIIGEAPGEQEDIQGEPFVGAAGQLLNKILMAIQFERNDVYIANILKHRPPGNRNPSSSERERSLPYLLRQIDLIQPKIILCLGRVSGTTMLGRDDSLKNLRGKFYPIRNTELTVTYHPAALLRNPEWKRPTWEDVQKVRERYDELGGKP
jgi:uracil-DNA glycosylase